mgnify:CR=1 FL=1
MCGKEQTTGSESSWGDAPVWDAMGNAVFDPANIGGLGLVEGVLNKSGKIPKGLFNKSFNAVKTVENLTAEQAAATWKGNKEITDSLFPSKGCYLASKALRKYGDTLS